MKISEHWLRESVDLSNISSTNLLEKLTAAGLEVEENDPVAGAFTGVVVAEIIAAEAHPSADRLRVCQVNAGGDKPLQIVCGAPNARVGLKAPLAMLGATLPGLQIQASTLRGVESQGMLCAGAELGIEGTGDGLLELPADAPLGKNLVDYLQLADQAITLKMTPNRSDCLSVRGLQRELCALFARTAKAPAAAKIARAPAHTLPVRIQASAACAQYASAAVRGIEVAAKTPLWMQEKLRRSGLRSIHPVVDITNFVMLELGQPMHGFDMDLIDQAIDVRFARDGESLVLLDGQSVSLSDEFLCIADQQGLVAVAGVMGGQRTRVSETTRNVFFEAAHFRPEAIMGKARKLGLHTDSSHRFERGVDPALPQLAIDRAVQLLLEIAGGTASETVLTQGEAPIENAAITLRKSYLDGLLGLSIPSDTVTAILTALGFETRFDANAQRWQVKPPSARFDIAIEADLVEEIARVHGYEHIPITLPRLVLEPETARESVRSDLEIKQILLARGYQEALTFAFTSASQLRDWGMHGHPIKNPLSNDIDVMRPSLLPNLLQALVYNQRRQQDRVRLMETGITFHAQGQVETAHIAGVACGSAALEQWAQPARAVDFYDVKADVEALLGKVSFSAAELASYLHPGRAARVLQDGHSIGFVGELHPELKRSLDVRGNVVVFELDLDAVRARRPQALSIPSKFPSVRRDLAFVVRESVGFDALSECVRASAGEALQRVDCFDVYRGSGLPADCKSLAISLIFQHISRTLSDAEIEHAVQNVVERAARELHAELRR
jgi:phenylalanyl-tRNA synthetase beta chain